MNDDGYVYVRQFNSIELRWTLKLNRKCIDRKYFQHQRVLCSFNEIENRLILYTQEMEAKKFFLDLPKIIAGITMRTLATEQRQQQKWCAMQYDITFSMMGERIHRWNIERCFSESTTIKEKCPTNILPFHLISPFNLVTVVKESFHPNSNTQNRQQIFSFTTSTGTRTRAWLAFWPIFRNLLLWWEILF